MDSGTKSDHIHLESIKNTAVMNIIENLPDMIFAKDINLIYAGASRGFAKLCNLDGDANALVGKTDDDIFDDKEIVERYRRDDMKVISTKKSMEDFVEAFIYADGKHGYCKTSKYPIFDQDNNVIGIYGISRDITFEYTAKIHYEQELKALFELPEDALGAALFDITAWRVISVRINNETACGYESFGTVDEYLKDFVNAAAEDEKARDFYLSCTAEKLKELYESGTRQITIEYKRAPENKRSIWVRNVFHLLLDPVTSNLCLMSIVHNIEKQKQAELALLKSAQLDSLTGVLNRETTIARIKDFLSNEGENGTHMLFMIDIDNFKLLNDTLGHQTGDSALLHIAKQINKLFIKDGIVGRIGGDEFFVFLKDVKNRSSVKKRASKLIEVLQYECTSGDLSVSISGSIGISQYSKEEKKDVDTLYSEADAALYRAKQLGKNCFIFSDEMETIWEDKAMLSTVNLRMLLENADAAIFQTEFLDGEDIRVTYSSHSLFSTAGNHNGYTGARVENVWESIFPEDLQGFKMLIKASTAIGEPLDTSCRVKTTSGKTEWRHICGSHLPGLNDGAHKMIHVVTDITKQKQTEAELREKNSIIDFAMKNTDINLWYFDYQTRACQLTQSCQIAHEMLGIEQLDNFPICLIEQGYVREDCHEELRSLYDRLSESGESLSIDVWFRREDGSGWWCERETISPLIGADGKITRGIGIGKDVTAEKLLQEKYESFGAYRRLAEKNTRVSIRLNLTTGWAGDCMSNSTAVRELYPTENVDEFFTLLRKRIMLDDKDKLDTIASREGLLKAYINGETQKSLECRFLTEEKENIWVRMVVEMVENPLTDEVEALFYSFDIDREKNMQFFMEKLLDEDYEFLGLVDVITHLLMVFGKDTYSLDTAQNGAIYENEAKRIFTELILPEYIDEAIRNMSLPHVIKQLEKKHSYTCSFPAKALGHTNAGRKQWKFSYLDSDKTKLVMTRTDITSLYTAEYDSLTGIFNKEAFYRRVREVLIQNEAEQFLLVRFDIDRFKAFNDIYGTQSGDKILSYIGRAAREGVWGNKVLAYGRIEADHFAMLVQSFGFDSEAWVQKHSIWIKNLADGYRLTSSAGVYPITQKSIDISIMCDRALLALSTIKENYNKKIAWYDERQRQILMSEQVLSEDMERAISEKQFVVYLQPQVDHKSGDLIGAEALVRWKHPERGLISPMDFIPLFEKNGFITKLDAFVWEKTCQMLRQWIDQGLDPLPVSVNVSRHNLYNPLLCQHFIDLLNQYNLPRSLLNLEITESAYMNDPQQLMEIVVEFRKAGFIVEMDDFGAGYSSLNMLKDMPVDVLKLDTVFISKSEDSTRATTILSSIVSMAHGLGLKVIAEGVETKEQAEELLSINCNLMQGYYFGRPMSSRRYEEILSKRKINRE